MRRMSLHVRIKHFLFCLHRSFICLKLLVTLCLRFRYSKKSFSIPRKGIRNICLCVPEIEDMHFSYGKFSGYTKCTYTFGASWDYWIQIQNPSKLIYQQLKVRANFDFFVYLQTVPDNNVPVSNDTKHCFRCNDLKEVSRLRKKFLLDSISLNMKSKTPLH